MPSMETVLKCSTCNQMKPTSEFHTCKSWKRGFAYKCKDCIREYKQKPDVRKRLNERERGYRAEGKSKLARRNRRIEAIKKLGGKCECCGEDRIEFLAFDHIDGLRGRGIKRNGGDAADALALRIRREENPESTFRVLCHNCNSSLGFYGYCPHKTKKDFLTR